jgi:pimeloyl-ACP methyl ester carboxylesterase
MLADLLKLQLDIAGARAELAAALIGGRLLHSAAATAGQETPVITIPGFLASEATLLQLNRFLNRQGFLAKPWGLGRNLGPRGEEWDEHLDSISARLGDRVKALADSTGSPVALIGQSLGGVYARELAMRMDEGISRVIMLGAPTFHPYKADRHNRVIGTFGYWFNRQSATQFAGRKGLLHWEPGDPDLPCVAIHSPVDGVVDEEACHIPGYIVDQSSRHAPRENLRVLSTHMGMCVSPWVLLAIADRLAADCGDWRAFRPMDYFPDYLEPLARLLYPAADGLWKDRGTAAFVDMKQ